MAVVRQLAVTLENRRGALAELCSELAKVAVNIEALMVPETAGRAPVRLVTHDLEAARQVFGRLNLPYREEEVLAARVSHRPGALGRLTRKLAEHGIDIQYAYGSILKGADSEALIILAVSDAAAAARVVKR